MTSPIDTHRQHTDPPHQDTTVCNHHAHHPGFRGVAGLAAAIGFLVRRGPDAELACELTGVAPGDHVVDVGCGPGVAVREARSRGARVTGIDPAPAMLRVARLVPRRRGARWVAGTAEELPVDDGVATVLWSIATVHHWSDVDQGLAEARRVLAPAGRFLAIERRRRPGTTGHAGHGWTDAQADAFATACRAAGFTDVAIEHHAVPRSPLVCVRATRPA